MTDRDDDGQPADLDIESLEDEGLSAVGRRRERPRRADVVGAVASTLVRRVLDGIPGGWQALAQAGGAVVVEVPNAAWVGPVADAWGRAVSSIDPEEHNGDGISRPSSWRPSSDSTWIGFRRDGIQKDHKPDTGNEAVAAGLAAGCVVVGFSPWPERHLPRALVRAADIRVATPTPDAAALDEALEILTGHRPSSPLPVDLHRLIAVEDLRLAWRPDTDADGYLARLRRLLDAKAKPPPLTLDHLHGMDEAVAWGMALTRDLDEYRRGSLPWSAVDRGVLLAGPSGTGKTTFAKALAGSCGVPLVVGSLSRWQSTGHLGDLLKAMRATFTEARAVAPAILFVDEIDAFGDRSGFTHENRDYSIQVVNGLLEELDGVEGREGVVVVGACNDPGRLDPAIVRSGRLDRTIPVPLPDREALAGILRHHLGADLPDADLSTAALLARGATGADCERWVRGARRRARHGGRGMTIDDLTEEIRGMRRERTPEETYRYAVHEAGHALMITLEFPGTLTGVSIRETADTLGGTSAALDQRKPLTRSGLAGHLRVLLAGRAAEEAVLGDVSAGAGGDDRSDLARATALAAAALHAYGLGDGVDGLLWRGMPTSDTLAATMALRPDVGNRVSALLATAYAEATAEILRCRERLEALARLLVEHETVGGADAEAVLTGGAPPSDRPPDAPG
ncbi:AAA+ superfamily predicted ATPase [Azospirillum agricola]|uniref:AAA family ATPase n=1 Tax=Azospirillum agricola TaxID=1720247 RepID=UPI001AE3A588|nr:AAA family ATPase [Azospirillum agricola]MBP2229688.1 AAA+ superfamily predicted ATPase [Azospirillum agricola]